MNVEEQELKRDILPPTTRPNDCRTNKLMAEKAEGG